MWRVRLADRARADIDEALRWTARRFGRVQAERYRGAIEAMIVALGEAGPKRRGRPFDPTRPDVLRVKLPGRARHAFFVRAQADGTILVLRVLHDAMDSARHLPPDDGG